MPNTARAWHDSSPMDLTALRRWWPLAAILGLLWNLCALPVYELPKVGIPGPFPFLVAVGFSALGFLPAVVVHSVLRGERDGVRSGWKRSASTPSGTLPCSSSLKHSHAGS